MHFLRLPFVALLLGASACTPDTTTPLPPDAGAIGAGLSSFSPDSRTPLVVLTRVSTPMSLRERSLIDRIIALHPSQSSAVLRSVLSNRYAQLQLPSTSAARGLMTQLSAARAVSVAAAPEPVNATVVLLDRLPDPGASAIVVRRTNALPHDVILLPSGQATPVSLRAGLTALFKLRRAAGDIPSHDARVVVRGAAQARAVRPGLQATRARLDLMDLRQSAPRTIAGYGAVRAIDVPLQSMSGARLHLSPATP